MDCGNILVVEDDVAIQKSLRFAMESEGYKVFTASNGKEGLETFGTMPKPCMILLDLMMPIMDGFEFLAERNKNPPLAEIPVIIVSAFPEKMKAVPADGYINKPVKLDALFELIKKYCL